MIRFFEKNSTIYAVESNVEFSAENLEKLVWLFGGNSRAMLDSVEYEMPEDSLFLAFPNQLHSYASYEDEGYLVHAAR